MNRKDYRPPPKKEPGLIGRTFIAIAQCLSWLLLSIMLSVLIEWAGMKTVWKEEGINHSKRVFMQDQQYLNKNLLEQSGTIKTYIFSKTQFVINYLEHVDWRNSRNNKIAIDDSESFLARLKSWLAHLHKKFEPYLQAALNIFQISMVRLAIILFSLPVFALLVLVGSIDGLVERDLRRWGGGRESSNVYNLARKSVFPSFIIACVLYISLPFSINPTLVILPFALTMGLSTRIMFERLKKYF